MIDQEQGRRAAAQRRVPRLRRRRSTRLGEDAVRERYGNLFDMYERITGEDPYQVPMRIYPAPHYTMGGLWVDYNLETTVPGLYAIGEANFSDHGANRLGASALMQGLADGYFVLPYTIGDELAPLLGTDAGRHDPRGVPGRRGPRRTSATAATSTSAAPARSTGSTASSARSCGTTAAWSAPAPAWRRRSARSPPCTTSSARTCGCSATTRALNQSLERAGRVDDFFQLGLLMCEDALQREESLRRPLPGRAPDRGGRGPAQRRRFRVRRRLGAQRARCSRAPSTRSSSCSRTSSSPSGATSDRHRPRGPGSVGGHRREAPRRHDEPHPAGLAPERPRPTRALRHLRRAGHQRGHVVPRDARHRERAPRRPTATSRSPSTTTAARASAAPAR